MSFDTGDRVVTKKNWDGSTWFAEPMVGRVRSITPNIWNPKRNILVELEEPAKFDGLTTAWFTAEDLEPVR